MGFFNRRPATGTVADTTTTTGTHTREKKPGIFAHKEPRVTAHGGRSWNSRPTFGQWIKATALDIITMAIMGAIGLGVYMADPAPSRSFPGMTYIQVGYASLLTCGQSFSKTERLCTQNLRIPCAMRSFPVRLETKGSSQTRS